MFFSFIPLLSSIGSCLHLCFFWVKTKQEHTETTEQTMHTIIRSFTNTPKHVRNKKKKKYERQQRIPTLHITLLLYPRTWRFILHSDLLGKVSSSCARESKKHIMSDLSCYDTMSIYFEGSTLFTYLGVALYLGYDAVQPDINSLDVSGECTQSNSNPTRKAAP
jgi:hypothetical protein